MFNDFGGSSVGSTCIAKKSMHTGITVKKGLAVIGIVDNTEEFLFKPIGRKVLLDEFNDNRRIGNEVNKGYVFNTVSNKNTGYGSRDGIGSIAYHLRDVEECCFESGSAGTNQRSISRGEQRVGLVVDDGDVGDVVDKRLVEVITKEGHASNDKIAFRMIAGHLQHGRKRAFEFLFPATGEKRNETTGSIALKSLLE